MSKVTQLAIVRGRISDYMSKEPFPWHCRYVCSMATSDTNPGSVLPASVSKVVTSCHARLCCAPLTCWSGRASPGPPRLTPGHWHAQELGPLSPLSAWAPATHIGCVCTERGMGGLEKVVWRKEASEGCWSTNTTDRCREMSQLREEMEPEEWGCR